MEKEFEYLPIDQIETTGTLMGKIGHRPYDSVFALFGIAVFMFILKSDISLWLGCGLLLCAVLVLLFNNHSVFDIYSDSLLFYNPLNQLEGYRIMFDDIVEWTVNDSWNCLIKLVLKDGSSFSSECLQPGKANRIMKQLLLEKQTYTIRRAASKKKKRKSLFN